MVAGAVKADLLADFAGAVDRAISKGKSIQAFRKDFDAIVEKHGWSYKGEYNWRTRTIYRTNMATSYAAGRLAQLKLGGFKYWMYRHSDSVANPRPLHVSWNGLTLPADDPWWKTHYPPNAWGCQCYVVGVSRAAGERAGGRFESAPNDGTEPDGRPKGIDKGWDYMPGRKALGKKEIAKKLARHDPILADMAMSMAEKTRQWNYELAKAYMQNVPESARDALAVAYRALPSVADDTRRYAERALGVRNSAPIGPLIEVQQYKTFGLLTSKDSARITGLTGVDVTRFDYALDRNSILHIRAEHGDAATEKRRGQRGVTEADYAKLPAMLSDPDSLTDAGPTWKSGKPAVLIQKTIGFEEYFSVWEIRTGRKMLVLQSMWVRKRKTP